MTNTTIENQALSIQLNGSESVTVPSNEVWKVTINGRAAVAAPSKYGDDQTVRRYCSINGVRVASSESKAGTWSGNGNSNGSASASTTFPIKAVLVEGDVIESDNTGLQIGGFVVN